MTFPHAGGATPFRSRIRRVPLASNQLGRRVLPPSTLYASASAPRSAPLMHLGEVSKKGPVLQPSRPVSVDLDFCHLTSSLALWRVCEARSAFTTAVKDGALPRHTGLSRYVLPRGFSRMLVGSAPDPDIAPSAMSPRGFGCHPGASQKSLLSDGVGRAHPPRTHGNNRRSQGTSRGALLSTDRSHARLRLWFTRWRLIRGCSHPFGGLTITSCSLPVNGSVRVIADRWHRLRRLRWCSGRHDYGSSR
jgi:hypothetical protein